jgi:ferric-dicitrate binding protein FerR (iron transport regulator)
MKTKNLEKWLLLEQSGELTPKQARQLARLLDTSAEARRLRADLDTLRKAVPVLDPDLPSWTVVKISARLREEFRPADMAVRVLKPVLLLAACLLLAAGLFNFQGESTTPDPVVALAEMPGLDVWNDPMGNALDELESLLVVLSGDPYDIMEM